MNSVVRITTVIVLVLAAGFGSNGVAVAARASDSPKRSSGPEQHVVTIEKLRVHYVESGTGSDVVLIHGNAGDAADFEFGVMDLLSQNYRVIAIDRPGHGDSDRPKGKEASVEYQARILHETLVKLGIKHPVLVGHSWGGSLALCYALKYPDDVTGMVLLAPAAYPDDREHALTKVLTKTPVLSNVSIAIGKALFGHLFLKQVLNDAFYPQNVPTSYFKLVAKTWLGDKQLRAYLEDQLILNDCLRKMKDQYSDIKIPVVIVTGDNDKIVSSKDNAYRLQKEIPGSRLIELKNTGHEIPLTRPESIFSAMKLMTPLPGASTATSKNLVTVVPGPDSYFSE